jgi:hypothetical protein
MSKLESLPNEILLDLLENYINLSDVLVAFNNHLNNRFDGLINQCKLFRLDLTNIRKKDFDHCIGSISTCRHKIESLFLSECIPGQISTFLLLFPTFDQFERLGELYLDFNGNVIDQGLLDTAMYSLSKTNIHTLTVKSTCGFGLFAVKNIFQEFFRLSTLRRLVLDVNLRSFYWNLKNLTHCNVVNLTIKGTGCTWSTFKKILTCAKNLSSLNVRVTANVHSTYTSSSDENFDIQPLKKLHTFIYNFHEPRGRMQFHLLAECLCQMPNLRYLEISNVDNSFLDGNIWKMFFQTSLPLVTDFRLKIDECFSRNEPANNKMMKSFQTPFWITKKNFNIYRISYSHDSQGKSIFQYYPIQIALDTNHGKDTLSFSTIPQRSTDNDYSILSKRTHLHLGFIRSRRLVVYTSILAFLILFLCIYPLLLL